VTFGPRVLVGDIDVTAAPYMLDIDYDLGNGVTVYDDLESLLRDGSLVSSTRTGNRTLVLPIYVEDVTGSQGRAVAGAALDLECRKPFTTVTVYPGDYGQPGAGPAMILDTFVGQSTVDSDPGARLEQAGLRRYVLTLPALPGVRSVEPVDIEWTGPSAVVKPVTSVTGWAVSAGTRTATTNGGVNCIQLSTTATVTVASPDVPLKDFLWIRSNMNRVDLNNPVVTIGGTVVPIAELESITGSGSPGANRSYILMVDVSPWRGLQPEIKFTLTTGDANGRIYALHTTSYPNRPAAVPTENGGQISASFGIGTADVVGTARAVCTVTFTAPAGGALVYTGPDPVAALRERGMGERVFGDFTVADADGVTITTGAQARWFPPGDHQVDIGATTPQPPALHPDGIWPTSGTGTTTVGDDATGHLISYPADPEAAVSFLATSGAKTLLPQTPALPEGYHGDAVTHDEHSLHPGRSGIGVVAVDGSPVSATFTYYPTWLHFPTQ
jgi:hypothetical protein